MRILVVLIINLIYNEQFMDINELFFVGFNKFGQAGLGEKHHNKKFVIPKPYAFSTFIKQVSCGAHHSAILTIDGSVYTMGSNIHGALGSSNLSLNYAFSPTLVDTLKDVSKIDCGPFHMCAISDGALYSWGKGIDGQLGHGNTKNISKPMKIELLSKDVESVSCGTNHTLAIVSNRQTNVSQAYSFGNGIFGQLGTGSNRNCYTPTRVKIEGVELIAAGENHSLFVSKGQIFGCGDNTSGQVGTLFNKKYILDPVLLELKNVSVAMIQAKKFSCALSNSGEIYVWGLKSSKSNHPKLLRTEGDERNNEIIDIRLGPEQVYGLSSNGELLMWNAVLSRQEEWQMLSKREKILSNDRPILDFSVGQNYTIVLGDIIKQISDYSSPTSVLQCFEIDENFKYEIRKKPSQSSSQFSKYESHELRNNETIIRQISSQIQQHEQKSEDAIQPTSNSVELKDNHLHQQPSEQQQFRDRSKPLNEITNNQFYGNHVSNDNNNDRISPFQRKQNTNGLTEFLKMNHASKSYYQCDDSNMSDHSEMIKTPSSSILCEPTNFLKESTRRQNYEIRKATIGDYPSELDDKSMQKDELKERIKECRMQNKENIERTKSIGKAKNKQQGSRIDRIMVMLEKSNNLSKNSDLSSSNTQEGNRGKSKRHSVITQFMGSVDQQKEVEGDSETSKSNRLLRIELRDKELKISQLQEILSRKQMQIEAQRELIKMLRQKNCDSNFSSIAN